MLELTTLYIASLIIFKCSILKLLYFTSGLAILGKSGKDFIILGLIILPPLIKLAVIIANSKGVDNKKPWPMPTFKVSPFCHFSLYLSLFHFLLGTILLGIPKKSS